MADGVSPFVDDMAVDSGIWMWNMIRHKTRLHQWNPVCFIDSSMASGKSCCTSKTNENAMKNLLNSQRTDASLFDIPVFFRFQFTASVCLCLSFQSWHMVFYCFHVRFANWRSVY